MKLASGGMATVYVGRVRGPLGFSRLVAIKRAHPHLLEDESFSRMLVDEAKLASRIHHPNVVPVLDIERDTRASGTDLRLVMEYVEGASLSELLHLAEARGAPLPPGVVVRIVLDACAGLQVAHELTDESGALLGLVHRDVSPHNVLVGVDGLARLSDFGIAKATSKPGSTTTGSLKGKLAYMAPEYVSGGPIDARADVFALGVVAWEAFAGTKLFRGSNDLETLQRVANAEVPPLSITAPAVGKAFDDALLAALARDPADRFSSVRAFGNALEAEAKAAGLLATHAEVATVVRDLAREPLTSRREQIKDITTKLDAQRTGGTTQDGPLRGAVDKAIRAGAGAPSEPTPSDPALQPSVPDAQPITPVGVDPTLGGSGISSPSTEHSTVSSTFAASQIPGLPQRRTARWFALAGVSGVLAAAATFAMRGDAPARRTASSVEAGGDDAKPSSSPSVAPLAASAGASPVPSSSPPTSASAIPSVRPAPVPAPSATPRPPTGSPRETVAPNPYGPSTPKHL
jgi:serine/threonine-protein kinase